VPAVTAAETTGKYSANVGAGGPIRRRAREVSGVDTQPGQQQHGGVQVGPARNWLRVGRSLGLAAQRGRQVLAGHRGEGGGRMDHQQPSSRVRGQQDPVTGSQTASVTHPGRYRNMPGAGHPEHRVPIRGDQHQTARR